MTYGAPCGLSQAVLHLPRKGRQRSEQAEAWPDALHSAAALAEKTDKKAGLGWWVGPLQH
jgi:hypothetical protein